ncbi:MAG TPA: hypothetical protein VNW99_11165 [Cytophagaceae bacterium]|jgi:hypothetical protein|nr:hypothetical protein [Cytophagaceae bacterium]
MLEIREQILSIIKERTKLILSEDKALLYEIIDFQDDQFIYSGRNSIGHTEDFRYSLSPKQALAKICTYYRNKGNIETVAGYKEIYEYMIENP